MKTKNLYYLFVLLFLLFLGCQDRNNKVNNESVKSIDLSGTNSQDGKDIVNNESEKLMDLIRTKPPFVYKVYTESGESIDLKKI